MRIIAAIGLALSFLAGCLDAGPGLAVENGPAESVLRLFGSDAVPVPLDVPAEVGDAVVVAVVDGGLNPYHWDFVAAKMPQSLDDDPSNDFALDRPAHEWLPGFPAPTRFASFDAIPLTLDTQDGARRVQDLYEKDEAQWNNVKESTATEAHVVWFPGTKVIAAVDFAGNGIYASLGAHGSRVASVSVGNLYGSCPECLLVFVNNAGEEGMNWVMSQSWIDVVTNSYGFSVVERERLYSGSDVEAQREATDRGLHILFSAGNGVSNTFTVPNPTLFSSQEGPDWITTVGAVDPVNRASYTGHGKPADIASIGSAYPSHGGTTVNGTGTFGGTSSATPTTAGFYARGLWWARAQLEGSSRTQADGTIAVGKPVACGAAHPSCELGDGILTVHELRQRLFHGAVHTQVGMTAGPAPVAVPVVGEEEFLNEGHGTYFARMDGADAWMAEFRRFVGPLDGTDAPLARPAGEREWMTVDSYCRQHLWGEWANGYYVAGETQLPGASPDWPLRSAIERACPYLFPPV